MDQLTRTVKIQIVVFIVIALASTVAVGLNYMHLPSLLFGAGRYTVSLELPQSGNLYATGNVTYRGTEVGRVTSVHLTETGVQAELSLKSGIAIPSDLKAEVHSQNAVGEQYVALLPQDGASPPLKDGDVIPVSRTSVPPNLNGLLDATNRGLEAIPNDNLKTLIDESYTAFGGLGPEFSRFVSSATALATGAKENIGDLTGLVDNAAPVLDAQADSSDSIQAWASHLASITGQLQTQDPAVSGILAHGGSAAEDARALVDRLKPTLPVILANMVTLGNVAVVYQADIEQLLVLLPQAVAMMQGGLVANKNSKHPGLFLDFNLNINLPPPCTTGFLPAQQMRPPSALDVPDRPAGEVYCRRPQDSIWNVRGARNIPCETRPGKRAATVKECESDEPYVPLNDGMNWKGDPNATSSGQDIPQVPPSPASPAPPVPGIAAAQYDPATGTFIGPDGKAYTQTNLAAEGPKEHTWQSMLMPSPLP
ncbi:mammalian cell entry protein [Mycolicibacterium anyangense]|uniref:Mammalian cell entry protein n=1 Tax=Mycolicibacterium anyangense TaxID=1431246 RepID=A0A6N4WAB9_9MYCO|nr:MlaD family protein [Mycolicibacterium anyangense]BBZ77137.1 mammalian cell entry protein [Mycolicibacterium anyangense]